MNIVLLLFASVTDKRVGKEARKVGDRFYIRLPTKEILPEIAFVTLTFEGRTDGFKIIDQKTAEYYAATNAVVIEVRHNDHGSHSPEQFVRWLKTKWSATLEESVKKPPSR